MVSSFLYFTDDKIRQHRKSLKTNTTSCPIKYSTELTNRSNFLAILIRILINAVTEKENTKNNPMIVYCLENDTTKGKPETSLS